MVYVEGPHNMSFWTNFQIKTQISRNACCLTLRDSSHCKRHQKTIRLVWRPPQCHWYSKPHAAKTCKNGVFDFPSLDVELSNLKPVGFRWHAPNRETAGCAQHFMGALWKICVRSVLLHPNCVCNQHGGVAAYWGQTGYSLSKGGSFKTDWDHHLAQPWRFQFWKFGAQILGSIETVIQLVIFTDIFNSHPGHWVCLGAVVTLGTKTTWTRLRPIIGVICRRAVFRRNICWMSLIANPRSLADWSMVE